MEMFEQFGVTQSMMQGLIIVVAVAIFLGFFWRYVVIGIGILFVAFVFTWKPSVAKVAPVAPVEVTKPAEIGRAHV